MSKNPSPSALGQNCCEDPSACQSPQDTMNFVLIPTPPPPHPDTQSGSPTPSGWALRRAGTEGQALAGWLKDLKVQKQEVPCPHTQQGTLRAGTKHSTLPKEERA